MPEEEVAPEVYPEPQRLVVGTVVKDPPLAEPQTPFTVEMVILRAEQLAEYPPGTEHDQTHSLAVDCTAEAVPLPQRLAVGATEYEPLAAEPQEPLDVSIAEQEALYEP
jgi:hypothetical protein